jgi:hypothetical protein
MSGSVCGRLGPAWPALAGAGSPGRAPAHDGLGLAAGSFRAALDEALPMSISRRLAEGTSEKSESGNKRQLRL